MRQILNDEAFTDGEKRLLLLKQALCEYSRDRLREMAEAIYEKGYDFENFPGLYKIAFEDRPITAEINYPAGEILFSNSRMWKSVIGRGEADTENIEIRELKNLLLYKPIFDIVSEKITELPDFYDADQDVLDGLGSKATLPKEVIEDRTIVDQVELSADDIETITRILEQEDFRGILEEYSAKVMTKYLEGSVAPAPGI